MEWTVLLDQIIDILLPILATFLTGFFTYLGTKLKATYEQKIKTETAKVVVDDVVKFVQQVYKDLDGADKLKKAIEQSSSILTSKGISITEAEINMLIESAVYGLKQGATTTEQVAIPETTEQTPQ